MRATNCNIFITHNSNDKRTKDIKHNSKAVTNNFFYFLFNLLSTELARLTQNECES